MPRRPDLDKRQAFEQPVPDLVHRLFYQARNLAIEAMLLRLSDALLRQGFNVRCVWSETSYGGPTVEVRLYNPKPGSWSYGTCRLHLNRERIAAPDEVSFCFYSLKDVATGEHWGARQPKVLLDFRAAVQAMGDSGHLAREILTVNYPFDYESHSPF